VANAQSLFTIYSKNIKTILLGLNFNSLFIRVKSAYWGQFADFLNEMPRNHDSLNDVTKPHNY